MNRIDAAYAQIRTLIRGDFFTDVILVPFLTIGGGEKYILNIISTLADLTTYRKFLVLTGEGGVFHQGLDRLPADSVFLDLFHRFPNFTNIEIGDLTLRIIQSVAPGAFIHMKSSSYAQSFFGRHHRQLQNNRSIVYRFSDNRVNSIGLHLIQGWTFTFAAEFIEYFHRVVVDSAMLRREDIHRVDFVPEKWIVLYNYCEPIFPSLPMRAPWLERKRCLLWASRIAPEKRPELLLQIAVALESAMPDVILSVWGSKATGLDIAPLSSQSNVRIHGAFENFRELEPQRYAAFIYTTANDGIPNVVLEAMSSGLPVIAPDIGGLPDIVESGRTGVQIQHTDNDRELVERYIEAIHWVLTDEDRATSLGEVAFEMVQAQHGKVAFEAGVSHLFEITPADRPIVAKLPNESQTIQQQFSASTAGDLRMTPELDKLESITSSSENKLKIFARDNRRLQIALNHSRRALVDAETRIRALCEDVIQANALVTELRLKIEIQSARLDALDYDLAIEKASLPLAQNKIE